MMTIDSVTYQSNVQLTSTPSGIVLEDSLFFLSLKLLLVRLNLRNASFVLIILPTFTDLVLFSNGLPVPSPKSAVEPLLLLAAVGALRRLYIKMCGKNIKLLSF